MATNIPKHPGRGWESSPGVLMNSRPVPGDPNYDAFNWWNLLGDSFGMHDDESIFKSAAENSAIRQAKMQRRVMQERQRQDPRIERMRTQRMQLLNNLLTGVQENVGDYQKAAGRVVKDTKGRVKNVRSNWENAIANILPAFLEGKEGYLKDSKKAKQLYDQMLGRWQQQYSKRQEGLSTIKQQQSRLLGEIENAPSSVAEQAKQVADEKLRASTAIASATGGAAGTVGQDLLNQTNTQYGDLMGKTASLRMQEQLQRFGMRGNLLGQQTGTEMQMAQLANVDSAKYSQTANAYRAMGLDVAKLGQIEAGLIFDKAKTGANLDIHLLDQMRQADTQNLKYLRMGGQDVLAAQLARLQGLGYEGGNIQRLYNSAYNRALGQRTDDRIENDALIQQTKDRLKAVYNLGRKALTGGFGGGQGAFSDKVSGAVNSEIGAIA